MAAIRVEATSNAGDFLGRAGSFLERREAAHCLTLGFAGLVRDHPELAPASFLVARAGRRVVATAWWFLDGGDVHLSEVDDPEAIPVLADAVGDDIAEVHAPVEHLDAFAGRLAARIGRRLERPIHGAEQRIFELAHVAPPHGVAGRLREAAPHDRPRLVAWLSAFEAEAIGGRPPEDADERMAAVSSRPGRSAFLWEVDGEPVSMCTVGGRTARGIRIGGVYTPPAVRGRGYASACVAAASQRQLDEGRSRCFLLTDLANPTSNHIYQAIGYRPVRDLGWRLLVG
jgi:RimJ/RimL family protein N-acetyltransferase